MKVIEIAFMAYPVTDLKRAKAFYEGTLGLETASVWGDENKGWVEYDIGPGTLAITNMVPDWSPSASGGGWAALEVEDFESAISKIRADGVTIASGPHETPVCHMAAVLDPDGNSVVIHKRKAG